MELEIGQVVYVPRRVPVGTSPEWDEAQVSGFTEGKVDVLVLTLRTKRFRWIAASKIRQED